MIRQKLARMAIALGFIFSPLALPGSAQKPTQTAACPAQIEPLVEQMLKDLPAYANRVIQRSRRIEANFEPTNMVVAGRAEFEPLPLAPDKPIPEDPSQVFITTLERTYGTGKIVELQQFHWVFLTKSETGWRLAMMFSRTGGSPNGRTPSPPQDSSYGVVAQAIQNWLRDCRARRG